MKRPDNPHLGIAGIVSGALANKDFSGAANRDADISRVVRRKIVTLVCAYAGSVVA